MLGYYNYTVILTYVSRFAVLCLMASGVCDMFDGAVASTKKRDTYEKHFGIQIDSLSDLICFGVLPALLLYCISPGNGVSLFIGSIYVLCALIRLAYFNVDELERQNETSSPRTIYLGLPVTLSALILPASFEIGSLLKISSVRVCRVTLICMAAAFLIPFKLKKPKLIGKICVVICGGVELILFLLAGVDV